MTMIQNLRVDYHSDHLEEKDLAADPVSQFHHWFQEALKAGVKEPNAMTLATCTAEGRPSARIVLLKDYSEGGFTFFTNYDSRKAAEMAANPYAALVFLWRDMYRQVRIEGTVEKVPEADSKAYFQSRPRGSQIGAWASPQSQVIESRQFLQQNVEVLEEKFAGQERLPLPDFWGGYVVRPAMVEFWQGQTSRLHDRLRYILQNGEWKVERLAP